MASVDFNIVAYLIGVSLGLNVVLSFFLCRLHKKLQIAEKARNGAFENISRLTRERALKNAKSL